MNHVNLKVAPRQAASRRRERAMPERVPFSEDPGVSQSLPVPEGVPRIHNKTVERHVDENRFAGAATNRK